MTCIETVAVVAEAVASILALGLSAVAIQQTRAQIELSNKQSLFDRRLAIYSMASKLTHYYETYRALRKEVSASDKSYAADFLVLAPDELFRDAAECISFPGTSSSLQTLYSGVEALGRTAQEARFVFSSGLGERVSRFVDGYASLLIVMHRYEQNVVSIASPIPDDASAPTREERTNHIDEDAVEKVYRRLDSSYVAMVDEGILDKVAEEIRLC